MVELLEALCYTIKVIFSETLTQVNAARKWDRI